MKNFSYYRPETTEAAVSLLDAKWGGVELLGGGTDLLELQKEHILEPTKLVSVNGIKGFDRITIHTVIPPVIEIGGGAKLSEIAKNDSVRQYCPALATAAAEAATPQIRNMATLGGNLCQHNRCWYFRDEHTVCLLKGGDKCFALDGDNRYHAVFTKGHKCVIVHPSTLAPALIALDAIATLLGPKGEREVRLEDFFQAPASEGEREHVAQPNEIVTSVKIKTRKFFRSASYEVRHKVSYDWPLVHACVAFEMGEDKKAKDVKIVSGHVEPTPRIADEAAKLIEGKEITEETAGAAGATAAKDAKPLSQTGYKVKLVEVAVKRALLMAAGAKRYWEIDA